MRAPPPPSSTCTTVSEGDRNVDVFVSVACFCLQEKQRSLKYHFLVVNAIHVNVSLPWLAPNGRAAFTLCNNGLMSRCQSKFYTPMILHRVHSPWHVKYYLTTQALEDPRFKLPHNNAFTKNESALQIEVSGPFWTPEADYKCMTSETSNLHQFGNGLNTISKII